MDEITKDILYMVWGFFGVLLIGVPAMLTASGIYVPWNWMFSHRAIEIAGISFLPILISVKLLTNKFFPINQNGKNKNK